MRKLFISVLFLLATANFLLANDGVFYSNGNTLVPLQETSIVLKKELLKFHIHDYSWMAVSVDFEFFNPGTSKRLTVGFVTPPGDGDISEAEQAHPQIKDFTVEVNGKRLAYRIKKMSETTFSPKKAGGEGNDFVYYFPVLFKNGVNRIRHTYIFRGGNNVELSRDFDYRITTGKSWANKRIDDFELRMYLDPGIYSIPAGFWKSKRRANWEIMGDGVLGKKVMPWFEVENPYYIRMVHLNRGYLRFKERNFKPDLDISLGEYSWGAGWIRKWCENEKKCPDSDSISNILPYFSLRPDAEIKDSYFDQMSKDELNILQNYAYALRGLPFTDKKVKSFYSRFFWYKPNEKLKPGNIRLFRDERALQNRIRLYRAKQKVNRD